ncbi:MAG TPA: PAS domain-containing protein [Frankiaceae bacterium]|nr:PAS domain-containing protein [Frankiaceae bacterium]
MQASDYESTRTRWQLAIEAAGIGGFDWNLVTGELSWDDRLVELFGYDKASFDQSFDAFSARLHPDDLPRVEHALRQAIDSCSDYDAEYRIVRPDGQTRWMQARGRTLRNEGGTAVRLLGAAYDTTAVQQGDARVARVLESMSAAFCLVDRSWCFSYVNAEAERFLGVNRDGLLGQDMWQMFPAMLGTDFERHYRRAMDRNEPAAFEAYYPAPLNVAFRVGGDARRRRDRPALHRRAGGAARSVPGRRACAAAGTMRRSPRSGCCIGPSFDT